jgi:hypothetical protein
VTRLARVVFAALVIATFSAFFAAQRLKHAPTVVQRFRAATVFSPNGDGRLDREPISFRIKKADDVTVDIIDARGDRVRRLVDDRHLDAYRQIPTLKWDGRTDSGGRAADGRYRVRITLRRQGRAVVVPRSFLLDTTPPRPVVYAIGPVRSATPQPELLPLPNGGPAIVRFRSPGRSPEVLVFKTAPGRPHAVLAHALPDGSDSWRWRGRARGRQVSPGVYLVVVRARDKAGNIGTSVPLGRDGLPVLNYGRGVRGHGGITVRYVGVQPPTGPTPAAGIAEFFVDTRRAPYTWSLRRIGGRPVRSGRGTRARLRIHAPKGASGVYLLTVRTRRHAATVPFAVQSPSRARVLVVLPVMTWQGRNPADDDGDGVPDVLTAGRAVRIARVLAGTGLPAGFGAHEAPALTWLDHRHHRYDITTDVALAAGRGPRLADYRGVLLPGDTRWLTPALGVALRRFVHDGGRLVSLGTDSLRRYVRLTRAGELVRPTGPAAVDVFGERLRPVVRRPVTLTIAHDSIGLFAGAGGLFSGYDAYEPTASAGAAIVASAVTTGGMPVVVAERLGAGLVARTGLPDFAAHLMSDPASAALMDRLWMLLSR